MVLDSKPCSVTDYGVAFGKFPSLLEPVSSSIEWRLGNTTPQGFVRIKQNMSQRVWGWDGEDAEGDVRT